MSFKLPDSRRTKSLVVDTQLEDVRTFCREVVLKIYTTKFVSYVLRYLCFVVANVSSNPATDEEGKKTNLELINCV